MAVDNHKHTSTAGDGGNELTPTKLTVDTNVLYVDDTNDRVGIGTTSPAVKCEVAANSSAGLLVSSAGSNGLRVTPSSDSNNSIFNVTNAANNVNWLTVSANGKVIMSGSGDITMDGSGRVGIGTGSPATKLHATESTILGAAGGSVSDLALGTNQVNIYLDESNNKLVFKVKYSSGIIKYGSVTLS